jgi:hypothetical protein
VKHASHEAADAYVDQLRGRYGRGRDQVALRIDVPPQPRASGLSPESPGLDVPTSGQTPVSMVYGPLQVKDGPESRQKKSRVSEDSATTSRLPGSPKLLCVMLTSL